MRRGLVTGVVLALLTAVAVLPAASVSAQPARTASLSPGVVKYEMTFTGLIVRQAHRPAAWRATAVTASSAADDAHAPFSRPVLAQARLGASQFKFGFDPSAKHNGQIAAQVLQRQRLAFRSYSGYGLRLRLPEDPPTAPAARPAPARCAYQGTGLLFAEFSQAHANERHDASIVQPFGGLVATPPSCNNGRQPADSGDLPRMS